MKKRVLGICCVVFFAVMFMPSRQVQAFSFKKFVKQTAHSINVFFSGNKKEQSPALPSTQLVPVAPIPAANQEFPPSSPPSSQTGEMPVGTGPAKSAPTGGRRSGAPTSPSEKAGSGASTVFDGQKTNSPVNIEGPIGGGGIGESAIQKPKMEPVKFTVETINALQEVIEEETVLFKAIVTFGDNSKKDVTAESEWKVLGPIGSIEKFGLFRARLDSSVSELGEGNGSVVATWKDPVSGKMFFQNSPIFQVKGKPEELNPEAGALPKHNFFGNLWNALIGKKK